MAATRRHYDDIDRLALVRAMIAKAKAAFDPVPSTYAMARALGVSQHTAWYYLDRVRRGK